MGANRIITDLTVDRPLNTAALGKHRSPAHPRNEVEHQPTPHPVDNQITGTYYYVDDDSIYKYGASGSGLLKIEDGISFESDASYYFYV